MSQPPDAKSVGQDPTAVTLFRQILLWPLFLHNVKSGQRIPALPSGFFDEITTELEDSKKWCWSDKKSDTVQLCDLNWYGGKGNSGTEDYSDYSEIVYFHSFVRDFLYGGDGTKAAERPLRVFRRTDVCSECDKASAKADSEVVKSGEKTDSEGAESGEKADSECVDAGEKVDSAGIKASEQVCSVCVKVSEEFAYKLRVERIELYVFHSGVAIFVLEVKEPVRLKDGSRTLPLAEIIDLQSVLRMAFPRRWNSKGVPSECPLSIELKAADG